MGDKEREVKSKKFYHPFIVYFFNVYFWERERERESRGGAEREGDRETQAGSAPSVRSRPEPGGHLVAQSVKLPTSAQVMISWFVSSSPALGFVVTAQSPEPAQILSPSLCPFPSHALSLKNK